MSNPLDKLLEQLTPAQRGAIEITKLALDCFNCAEGTGLFTGASRYDVLAGRIEICAVQANSLPRYWALLLRRMQWTVPPKSADSRILSAISGDDAAGVLLALATETPSIVTLARMAHDADKAARKALRQSNDDPFGPEAGNLEI